MHFDVLIVGGGPAGLSAALILGRSHRRALLCDEGRQRNLSSHAIHGLLGHEGRSPSAFLDQALEELSHYKSVSVCGTRVTDIIPAGEEFNLPARTGRTARLQRSCSSNGCSLTSFLNSTVSNPSTGFPCITVFTVTVSNMPECRSPPIARATEGAELAVMIQALGMLRRGGLQ